MASGAGGGANDSRDGGDLPWPRRGRVLDLAEGAGLGRITAVPMTRKAATEVHSPRMTTDSDHDVDAAARTRYVTQVFERFRAALLRYLKGLLARREDAEDVAQETYVRLIGTTELDRSDVRVRAYMFKVATNLAYDRFRARRVRKHDPIETLDALPDTAPSIERIVTMEQSVAIVRRAMLELPLRCRQVFLLRVSEELGYEAIAARLGVSKRTVEREMQHALDVCQRRLKEGE
jgi:RNA polymerase sigma factor (sigma-70 family)